MKLRHAAATLVAALTLVAAPLAAPAAASDQIPGANRTYTISVKTGDVEGGGTDSNVSIRMKGVFETTDWITLDNYHDNHEAGRLDVYEIKHHDIGEILAIDVWSDHTGKRADWYLDWIHIQIGHEISYFPYGGWFTKNQIVGIDNWLP